MNGWLRSQLVQGVVTLGLLTLLLSAAGGLTGTAHAAQAHPATPPALMILAARPGVWLGQAISMQPRSAAVPQCYLSYCDGDDPYLDHCNTGTYYVVDSAPLEDIDNGGTISWNYGYVQLWWSNTCRANWTVAVFKQIVYPSTVYIGVKTNDSRDKNQAFSNSGNGTYHSQILIAPNNLACSTAYDIGSIRFIGTTGQFDANSCDAV